jgi:putative ABC transport system ATP-binding protein
MPTVARLEAVRKVYDLGEVKVEALRGVDLDFEEGDFCAIMGSSGSGKSTLLNILGCLDRPSSGAYFLGDQNVAELDDDALSEIRGRRLGFIFQSYNLIQQLTVVENIEVPLFYQGMDTPEMREYCIALAARLGLGDRLDHRPMQLSGGQQQRVATARALVNDPFVILADEATGNLDTTTSEEIMALLCQLNESGKTILMVTHEDDIARYAKRIVRMRDGQVMDDEINHGRRKPAAMKAG